MGRDPVVLVTGAGGQVGSALREILPTARFATRPELDVRDASAVHTAVRSCDVVIHLAAMTDVDGCERSPDEAFAVNAGATATIASAARDHGVKVVYVSTDYVFDGSKSSPYNEDDDPAPLNIYGRTKLAGEHHVAQDEVNLILRTSWVYGRGRNFVRTILDHARAGATLRVVDDQHGRPTAAADIARALARVVGDDISGVVHYSGDGSPASWADVAERAVGVAGLSATVERVSTADYVRARGGSKVAPRPANSVLALDRAEELGLPVADWRSSLDDYVRAIT